MPRKTRKSNAANKSDVNRNKENEEDSNNLSLPVLSDEKIYSVDKSQIKSKSKEVKVPDLLIPKVRLTCLPLNIEKVIDLTTSKIVKNGSIKKSGRNTGAKVIEKNKKLQSFKNAEVKKPKRTLRPRFKDEEEYRYLYKSPLSNTYGKKIKIYIKESKFTLRKKSVVCCKNNQEEFKPEKQSLEEKTEDLKQETNINKVEVQKAVHNKVNNVEFDLASKVGKIKDEESGLKETNDRKSQATSEVRSQNRVKPVNFSSEKHQTLHQSTQSPNSSLEPSFNGSNELRCPSLQTAVESFINNFQLENQNDIAALKKGLCLTWMSNNYKCTIKACPYHHNACHLFTKKLKRYSFKYVMTILLAMKNDTLFVDAVLAAFKILSERKAPTFWITFLIYFVFYVTEPSDSRFFKFWASVARYFCQLSENFAAARGFASLLSIFSHGDNTEEWKIVEFIKFIKQSPIQIPTTYDLLQPVLKLNLPSQFWLEAIEHSIASEKDVLEVYSLIIPKLSITTSPVPVIEILLRFCNSLESFQQEHLSVKLKEKLREKVQTFKIKIFYRDYPLTAKFQEEVLLFPNAEYNHLVDIRSCNLNSDEQILLRKINYFQPENDFYNIIQAFEMNSGKLPDNFNKPCETTNSSVNEEEENACDRQVIRVKQFFADCHFEVLGKYLNSLKLEFADQTAQEFLKALFQMKITLQQVLDLTKIILLQCVSETASKINASICITLIVHLVRINEWEKAYVILALCEEKKINLIQGKVYYFNELSVLTQFRVLLLIVELYIYKENFQTVLSIVKAYNLHSTNPSAWKLTWNNNDKAVRVRILEEFLAQVIAKQLIHVAYDLFMSIWIQQNGLKDPVDLEKFTNDILILLLNQSVKEGVKFFQKIRCKVTLDETATRAILVSLIGQNNLPEAKSIILTINQTVYTLPEVTSDGATVTMSSFWLEEEIYVVLDFLFDMLTNEMNPALRNYENFEVTVHIVKSKATPSSIRPLCLGLINSSLEHACKRIERVLQNQFRPPIKLIIWPYSLTLDKPSLQLYLERRFRHASQ